MCVCVGAGGVGGGGALMLHKAGLCEGGRPANTNQMTATSREFSPPVLADVHSPSHMLQEIGS